MKKLITLLTGLAASFMLLIPVASAQSWSWVTPSYTYTGQPMYNTTYVPYGYSNPSYVTPTNYYYKKVTKVSPVTTVYSALSSLQGNYYHKCGTSYCYNGVNVIPYTHYYPYTNKKYYNYGYKIGKKYQTVNGGYSVINPSYNHYKNYNNSYYNSYNNYNKYSNYTASNYTWPVSNYAKYLYW